MILLMQNGENVESREITLSMKEELFKESTGAQLREFARKISAALKQDKFPPITLLIRSEKIYKNALFIPIPNSNYAEKLYKKEEKRKTADGYTPKTYVYRVNTGFMFNTYYVPTKIIKIFRGIAKHLSSKLESAKPYGFYLNERLQATGEYIYFYIRQRVCTVIYQKEGAMVTAYDFCFKSAKELSRRYLLAIEKYEFENESVRYKCYGMESDEKLELKVGLQLIEVKEREEDEEEQD